MEKTQLGRASYINSYQASLSNQLLQLQLRWIKLVSCFWKLSTNPPIHHTKTSRENVRSICEPKWVSRDVSWDVIIAAKAVTLWMKPCVPSEEETRWNVHLCTPRLYWVALTRNDEDGNAKCYYAMHSRPNTLESLSISFPNVMFGANPKPFLSMSCPFILINSLF